MAKARVTTTNALMNVIDVVELGQRTGLLAVERGSGSVQETGEIYFASGRPIYASLAGLRGREALAALSRWGACRFSFDREALQPAPNLNPPSAQQGQTGYGNQTPQPYESSAGWPSQAGTLGGMSNSGGHYGGYTPAPPGAGNMPGQGMPQGSRSFDGSYPAPNTPSQYGSYPAPNTPSQYGSYPAPNTPSQYGAYPGGPQHGQAPQGGSPLSRRPRRAPDVRDLMTVVTTHNLSRGHRTLLLLADGEHSVLDLARLSSKSVDEVMSLLADLESRSLIYYYG